MKNMAQGSVFRGHYSNQFDCNDPQILALALFALIIAADFHFLNCSSTSVLK
jgi:hypothetical protein